MKNKYTRTIAVTILGAALLGLVFATASQSQTSYADVTGPNGKHFNLNLIGKDKDDILPNDSNKGHRIFVNLYGKSKIWLSEGPFGVIDADATDSTGGKFQLPAPCKVLEADNTCGTSEDPDRTYYIWIRELGKPGGTGSITSCGVDGSGNTFCNIGVLVVPLERSSGKPIWSNVTRELTTVCADFDGDGTVECVAIFDKSLEKYFWEYDNDGLKHAQLRFAPHAPHA